MPKIIVIDEVVTKLFYCKNKMVQSFCLTWYAVEHYFFAAS